MIGKVVLCHELWFMSTFVADFPIWGFVIAVHTGENLSGFKDGGLECISLQDGARFYVWWGDIIKETSNLIEASPGMEFVVWKNKKDQYHRLDGPALIEANGNVEYWKNGKRMEP